MANRASIGAAGGAALFGATNLPEINPTFTDFLEGAGVGAIIGGVAGGVGVGVGDDELLPPPPSPLHAVRAKQKIPKTKTLIFIINPFSCCLKSRARYSSTAHNSGVRWMNARHGRPNIKGVRPGSPQNYSQEQVSLIAIQIIKSSGLP